MSEHEERRLLHVLNSPEYRDLSPRQVIPALAEQGTYIASEATAYRVLHKHDMQKHRTNTRPPTSKKPDELVARAPNQVYCWDITYLKRNILGTFFYLYLVTEIFSRRIVAARVYCYRPHYLTDPGPFPCGVRDGGSGSAAAFPIA